MNSIYYLQIGKSGSGLTNQLFTFITSILIHSSNDIRAIIIDNFQDDFQTDTIRSPISSIFDMQKMNLFLKNNFNILIFDKNDIVDFKIKTVTYGVDKDIFDITDEITSQYYKENTLFIPKNIIFNNIKGDPKPNIKKSLSIQYSINDEIFNEIFPENPLDNIVFNLSTAQYIHKFRWINAINRKNFDYILKNICFNSRFIKTIPDFKDKINVLHLRIENDAVTHWSKQNNMSSTDFQIYIEDKYIDLIKKHVLQTDENIILTYSENNRVVDYLKNNKYKYYISKKTLDLGREVNAISDLLISEKCNNIFIGGFNIEKLNGSTFSYCILQKINRNVKKILIDLDQIQNKEYIY